jgi:general stress protein 26
MTTDDSHKVAELLKGERFGFLTTITMDGRLTSRPMTLQEVEFDGDLWFFAERDSRKVAHIAANSHVGVTLTSNDTWISLDGDAVIVEDREKAKELWNQWVAAWLPQGPQDPSVVLIKVNGHSAEYWDTPGGRIASVISFVKAKVTGDRYEGGENERVRLEPSPEDRATAV